MAKKITTGKREKEKQKQAKRVEKQKRKEERQSNSTGGSLDDMIAYVDENGNITSTPPDMTQKEEIDIENIQISTPKKIEVEEVPLSGRVEYFTSAKGYGFIKDASSGEKYFFHISSAPAGIAEGNTVSFELERSTRGMNAVRINIIK